MNKYTLLLALIFVSIICQAQFDKPVTFDELKAYSRSSIESTLSEGEYFSLVATSIVLAEFDNRRPDKVLEIKCVFDKHDGSQQEFHTYHRQIFKATKRVEPVDDGFFILRDESLRGVKSVKVQIGVRSLNTQQSQLFQIASNLLGQAVSSFSPVSTIRDLLKVNGDLEEENEIPLFNATFTIPNNFINFQQLEDEDLSLAFLKPKEPTPIAFESESNNVPRGVLARFANIILGKDVIKDRERIGGVLVLKTTKKAPSPPEPLLLSDLNEIVRSFDRNKSNEEIKKLVDSAYEKLDIAYSSDDEKESSAYHNVTFFLTLTDLYLKYRKTGTTDATNIFVNEFMGWYNSRSGFYAIQDQSRVSILDIYDRFNNDASNAKRTAHFYIPNNLPNALINRALFMQYRMHIDFKNVGGESRIRALTTPYVPTGSN